MCNFRKSLSFAVVSFLLAFALSAYAGAQQHGTILLKSGERIENVKFEINKFYKVIAVVEGNTKRNISFTDVQTIYDRDGFDITVDVIGGYYKSSEEKWQSQESPQYRSARTKPWAIAFRIGGNYSIPLGNYYEGIDPGIGYEGDLIIGLTRQLSLRATVSKSGMKLSNQFGFLSLDPNIIITRQEMNINAMRYLLSLQFQNYKYELSPGKGYIYSTSGLGFINHNLSAEIWYTSYGDPYYDKLEDNEGKFIMNLGFGGGVVVTKNVALDLGLTFDMIFLGSNQSGYATYAYILDLKLGAMVYLE